MGRDLLAQARIELAAQPAEVVLGKSCAMLLAIDDGEIMEAQRVLERSDDADVRDYAEQMIDDHGLHAEQTTNVLADAGAVEIETSVAAMLRAQSAAHAGDVEAATDVDFTYLRVQVVQHSAALVLVTGLVDYAPSDDAARWLTDTEATIRGHRARAEVLLSVRE